jgi:hypothetical protein
MSRSTREGEAVGAGQRPDFIRQQKPRPDAAPVIQIELEDADVIELNETIFSSRETIKNDL